MFLVMGIFFFFLIMKKIEIGMRCNYQLTIGYEIVYEIKELGEGGSEINLINGYVYNIVHFDGG